MTDTNESIDEHLLFAALTRPAMTAGVTFEYHVLNVMLSMTAFIALNPLYGMVFIPLHAFGWIVCREEPRFFKIVWNRLMNLPYCPNQSTWGVRCYEPF